MIREEQETSVSCEALSDLVHIWSSQPKVCRALVRDNRFTVVRSGEGWVEATIPADRYSPLTGARRSLRLTPEQRSVRAERLRARNSPSFPQQYPRNS